jgi:integrase
VRSAPATSGTVVAARTIRHRCRVLADLYHTLDGATAPTPVDEAKVPGPGKTPPVAVPAPVIESTLTRLARLDQKVFAQFAVAATCAQRPCQVGRARPDDVDIFTRIWLVRDAKGEAAHTITLDDPQVAAWEAFIVADAWGEFDTSKYGRIIHEAGWPKGIRPYAARHSFAVNAIRNGVSLGDLQALLGHASPLTTRKFYAPYVIDRQRVVSDQVKGYLADVFKLRLVKA